MRNEEYQDIADALGRNPDIDLPADQDDFVLVAEFLDRNPEFDTTATDDVEQRRALQGTDRDVYVPERDADLERLIDLLEHHEDVDLLANLLGADDTGAILHGLGIDAGSPDVEHSDGAHGVEHSDGAHGVEHSDGAHGGERTAADGAGGTVEEIEGLLSSEEDEEDGEIFGPGNLDQFGERLGYAAGGLVSVFAVVMFVFQGLSFDLSGGDGWLIAFQAPNANLVVLASAGASLVAGVFAGFGYRVIVDEPSDGHRQDLTECIFLVPFVGVAAVLLLYVLVSTVGTPLLAGEVAGAVGVLIVTVILVAIFATPVVAGLFIGVAVVVGLPTYVGVVGGSLLGGLAST